MIEIKATAGSEDFENKLIEVLHKFAEQVNEERKREYELPPLLSRNQLAEEIFQVSPQTLKSHVVQRADFPKLEVGDRVLYPRDQVLEWIRKQTQMNEQQRQLNLVK